MSHPDPGLRAGHPQQLRRIVLLCLPVFAVSWAVATFTGYPEWMWAFLFVGLIGSVAVASVTLILLAGHWVARGRANGTAG